MSEISYQEVSTWPKISLFRGVRMKYKGRELYFPAVYMGPSEMDDFDKARSSIEFKEAKEDVRESVATKKAITLCSRVLLRDAYLATTEDGKESPNVKMSEEYARRERKRVKIQKQMKETEDLEVIEGLQKKLDLLPELKKPEVVFPNDETALGFNISNMYGAGTKPVDALRIMQAFQKLNDFEQEDVEDFTSWPS